MPVDDEGIEQPEHDADNSDDSAGGVWVRMFSAICIRENKGAARAGRRAECIGRVSHGRVTHSPGCDCVTDSLPQTPASLQNLSGLALDGNNDSSRSFSQTPGRALFAL